MRMLLYVALLLFASKASAQLQFCNKTIDEVSVATMIEQGGEGWRARGWWDLAPGECASVERSLPSDNVAFYAKSDNEVWRGGDITEDGIPGCIVNNQFDSWEEDFSCSQSTGRMVMFSFRNTGPDLSETINLTSSDPDRQMPDVQIGEIDSRCLFSWDDSHQVHSVRTVIEWNFQKVVTTMKKLRHCYRLRTVGPVDIEGLAKGFVDHCIDQALHDRQAEYIIRALAALAADIYGGGGSISAANLAEWIDNVRARTVACLTDSNEISDFVVGYIGNQINASVTEESHWEFWEL